MIRATLLTVAIVAVVGTASVSFQGSPPQPAMLEAVEAFLSTLEPEQVRQVKFPFNGEERFDWHFIPKERLGVPFKTMTPAQQEAALELLRVGYSQKGYSKAETIRKLELVLFEMSGRAIRDPDLYFFMIFGEPSEHGTWGWRYEGHHISQSWTIVNGTAIATTPQFFGSNPAEVRDGSMKGTRALAAEEDKARALLNSLTPTQRAEAILSDTAPRDILTSAERQAAMQEDRGLAYGRMSAEHQAMLWALIEEYASAQPLRIAQARLSKIRSAGLDDIKFGWMGGLERGEGHYYRVQGSTFLIEYDNTQNNANHVHSVWRDFAGDFGRDLLAAHYRLHPHRTVNVDE